MLSFQQGREKISPAPYQLKLDPWRSLGAHFVQLDSATERRVEQKEVTIAKHGVPQPEGCMHGFVLFARHWRRWCFGSSDAGNTAENSDTRDRHSDRVR